LAGEMKGFFLFTITSGLAEAHPTSCPTGARGSLPGDKVAGV